MYYHDVLYLDLRGVLEVSRVQARGGEVLLSCSGNIPVQNVTWYCKQCFQTSKFKVRFYFGLDGGGFFDVLVRRLYKSSFPYVTNCPPFVFPRSGWDKSI